MAGEQSEYGDELRDPALNAPHSPGEVAERADAAQGFEVEEALPGEDLQETVDDDEYVSALAGFPNPEPEADAEAIDRADQEAGLGQGFRLGEQNAADLGQVDAPRLQESDPDALAAPSDPEHG